MAVSGVASLQGGRLAAVLFLYPLGHRTPYIYDSIAISRSSPSYSNYTGITSYSPLHYAATTDKKFILIGIGK
jgi:hypothetical protein